MAEGSSSTRGYKQARIRDNKPINSCHIMFIIVYSSFIILNYGFLYLLNFCTYYFEFSVFIIFEEFMYLLFLNLFIYYFEFMYLIYVFILIELC